VPEENNVSCLNSRAILDFVRRKQPRRMQEVFSGFPAPFSTMPGLDVFLSDETNWIPSSLVVKLFENARAILDTPNTAFDVGFESITHRQFSYIQKLFLTIFSSPRGILRRLNQMNTKLNNTKIIELVYDSPGKAVIRWHWREGIVSSKDICSYNQGIYSAIPTLWGLPPLQVKENTCHFEGGPYCEIVLNWSLSRGRFRNLLSRWFTGKRRLFNALEEVERKETQLKKRFDEVTSLNTELARKVAMMKALNDATRAMVSAQDTMAVMDKTMKPIVDVLGFDRALIMLVDEKSESLEFKYGVGVSPDALDKMKGYRIPLTRDQNLMIRVLKKKRPVIVRDVKRAGLNPANLILADFKPQSFVVAPLLAEDNVIGILGADRGEKRARVTANDGEFLSILANSLAAAIWKAREVDERKSSYVSAVQALVQAVEQKDPYTRGHSDRVAFVVVEIARTMGLPEVEMEFLHFGSILHDVGKIGIPESIVRSPKALTEAEFRIIQQHPLKGVEILHPISFIKEHLPLIRNHHERFDGKGYPDKLKGEDIPLGAQIVCVADSFDAMISSRPYRKGLPPKQAAKEIRTKAGTQFAPRIADAFMEVFESDGFLQKLSFLLKK
jgi:putative nucleotidyltransferase with HDIG domain